MRIERLTSERVNEFVAYCRKHRKQLDDSFLYDEDLKKFKPDEENPTYLAVDVNGAIKAVSSLMVDDYAMRGKKARFRIFYSEENNIEVYRELLQAILHHSKSMDKIFVFVPIANERLTKAIKALNFAVERYAFVLLRDDPGVQAVLLPAEYELRDYRANADEEAWCEVRNASFATLKGSETPMTPEMVKKMMEAEDRIEGASKILYHGNRPVGVIRGSHDDYEGSPIMDIGPVAVIPEYQGLGLGRMLLRSMLQFAKEKDYTRTILSVNAENERAQSLYIQEGFKQIEAVACYAIYI